MPEKPLLLLDVDGPLNPTRRRRSAARGIRDASHAARGWSTGRPLRVWLNPDHGTELRALAEAYELVWATTWKGEANTWIGPRLGLPGLPFVDWPAMHGRAPAGTFWKTQYLLEYAAGRPFAWVDDDITVYDREYVGQRHLAAALLLRVDPRIGLVRQDFDALHAWAAAL